MSDDQLQILLAFFKTLAEESRLKILGLLSTGERSVGELAALLDLKEPTVSHHLAKLKELDLVEVRAEGNTRFYQLKRQGLEAVNKQLFSLEMIASWADDVEAEAWERKVLTDFFENGRLKDIPAQRKKRDVILRWLASQFEVGREYTEMEVNDLIRKIYPDSATLRREMIEQGLLKRERNIYWRLAPPQA
ncbi:MAG TPA: metalloregulator ArsR/SmtB family transcription factor [Aggregatilinea sp.]|uniref:DUF2087 domain-containing protein n=1 Tax=Aggregatilinea sp. TaxID=2806333 RepID=UPI002B661EAA|nr:metalloregulator ArsR/SmtB family transcription factor [Aggregatilinea sp.]HML24609.1 metalloregulator ArsR/SmtB family transcription factor [Aggregatilinea sp.]